MQNTQHNIEQDTLKPIRTETSLSKEKFKEFYTFLNIIKPHFIDLCVVNGKFRARSDDATCIVETEFSYFKGIDIYIANIKMLVKTLFTLDKKTAITIAVEDTSISFSDGCQNMQVMKEDPEFIDNKFITDEEMERLLNDNLDANKLFIKEKLPKSVVCNINKITRDFNTNAIKVKHAPNDLNRGYFYISKNNTREYTIKLKEAFLIPMKRDHFFIITSLPFMFNKSDMTLFCYLKKDSNIVSNIYHTKVDGLLIYIFSRSAIHEETE